MPFQIVRNDITKMRVDAIEVAGNMGIQSDRAANFHSDSVGTSLNYEVLDGAVSAARHCCGSAMSAAFDGGAWKKKIDRDFEDREE